MKAIKIHENDNTAVVLEEVQPGYNVIVDGNEELKANDFIPVYHKIALEDINVNTPVIKYGEIIGLAASDIRKGDYIHEHNVKSVLKTNN